MGISYDRRMPCPYKSINTDAAMALDGVLAVLTAKDLEPLGLHWMPTLAGDKQMVLADGKVLFQGQEVAYVVAKIAILQPMGRVSGG